MAKTFGRVVGYFGPMGSGKTKQLISLYKEMVEEGLKVQIFKPFLAREGEQDAYVHARNGEKAPATVIDYMDEIPAIAEQLQLDAVLIDEIQFFDDEYPEMIVDGMAMAGVEVYLFGLDVTSENETFGVVGELMAHADQVEKLHAPCVKCGEPARISKFVGEAKEGVIQVGDLDEYQPHCRSCYYGWEEHKDSLYTHANITLGGSDFQFTGQFELARMAELGYSPETIIQELDTMEKIIDFILKMKGVKE